MEPQFSPDQMSERVAATFDGTIRQSELMSKAFQRHAERISRTHSKRLRERFERTTSVMKEIGGPGGAGQPSVPSARADLVGQRRAGARSDARHARCLL
jgi:hypothetical protein